MPSLLLYSTYVCKLGNMDPGHDSSFFSLSSIVPGPVSSIVLHLGGVPITRQGGPIFVPTPVLNTPSVKTRMQGNSRAILPPCWSPPGGGRGAPRLCVGGRVRPGGAQGERNQPPKVQKTPTKRFHVTFSEAEYAETTPFQQNTHHLEQSTNICIFFPPKYSIFS